MPVPDLHTSLKAAIDYADANDIEVPLGVRARARRVGAIKAIGDLAAINSAYHDALTQALIGFFESNRPITTFRNAFRRAMVDNLGAAFDLGWLDGGGTGFPDGDALHGSTGASKRNWDTSTCYSRKPKSYARKQTSIISHGSHNAPTATPARSARCTTRD